MQFKPVLPDGHDRPSDHNIPKKVNAPTRQSQLDIPPWDPVSFSEKGKTMKFFTDMFANKEEPTILDNIEETVRERAYLLWEAAGRPEGDGVEFWLRAEEELSA